MPSIHVISTRVSYIAERVGCRRPRRARGDGHRISRFTHAPAFPPRVSSRTRRVFLVARRSFGAASQTFARLSRNHRRAVYTAALVRTSSRDDGAQKDRPCSLSLSLFLLPSISVCFYFARRLVAAPDRLRSFLKNVLKNQNRNAFIATPGAAITPPRSCRRRRRRPSTLVSSRET